MSETYTRRAQRIVTVADVADGGRTVTWDDGWSFGGIPAEHAAAMRPGAEFILETRNFSMVVGMSDGANWLWRKSDEDLDREHAEMVARHDAERQEWLRKNHDDWLRREAMLPPALRRRLDRFHANGGQAFKADGWGYELTVCELAALYARSGQTESQEVDEYAKRYGTSGNQHDYAKALSRYLTDDPADEDRVANSASALSPITGDADYSGSADHIADQGPRQDAGGSL